MMLPDRRITSWDAFGKLDTALGPSGSSFGKFSLRGLVTIPWPCIAAFICGGVEKPNAFSSLVSMESTERLVTS